MAKQQNSDVKETSSKAQGATIIDGDTVEAPAEPSPQPAQKAVNRMDADSPPWFMGVARLSRFLLPMAVCLSFIAVFMAGYALWLTSVTPQVSSAQVSPNAASISVPAVTELDERVDRIDADLAAALAAYKSELKRLQDLIDATKPTAVAPAPQADLLVELEMRLAALESGWKRALARRDNPPANPQAADRLLADSAEADRGGFETLAASNKPSSSGLGLLLASGLLADNLAGQPLTRWIDLLQQHSRVTGTSTRFAALVNAAAAEPEPIPLLMRRAQMLQPLLVAALNAAADDAGFLQRAGARLGQLVQLRAASPDQAGNAGALQAFEMALSQQDFDGVLIALGGWQGDIPGAVDKWRLAAEQRRALDAAVRATVAGLLEKGMESN